MSIERLDRLNEYPTTPIGEAERQKLIRHIDCLAMSAGATEQISIWELMKFNDVGLSIDMSRGCSRLPEATDNQVQEKITIRTWLENRDWPTLRVVCGNSIPTEATLSKKGSVSTGKESSTTDYQDEATATILADAVGKFVQALITHRHNPDDLRLQTPYNDIVYILTLDPGNYAWRVMGEPHFSTERLKAMAENVRELPGLVEHLSQETKLGTFKNTKVLANENGNQRLEFSNVKTLRYDIEGEVQETQVKSLKVSNYYRTYRGGELKLLEESVSLSIDHDSPAMIEGVSKVIDKADYGLKIDIMDLPQRQYPGDDRYLRQTPQWIATRDNLFWFQAKIKAASNI